MKKMISLMAMIVALMIVGCGSDSKKSETKNDGEVVLTDVEPDKDGTESDSDSPDPFDKDAIEPDDDSICGNSKLETGETCEKGETKECASLDNKIYESGAASCKSDCSGWNVSSCTKKQIMVDPLYEQYFPLVDGKQAFSEQTVADQIVVNDPVTKLMWAKEYAQDKTWQQAIDYCSNLTYAGYSDWRLPTPHELGSLINYTTYDPASNFPDMPFENFWSSSVSANNSVNAWYVTFTNGQVYSGGKDDTYYARCVRGSYSIIPIERFTVSVNGEVITDNITKLVWAKKCPGYIMWEKAIDYCSNLTYAGYDDWRLPAIHELASLVHLEFLGLQT